jgi:hypothetical protein
VTQREKDEKYATPYYEWFDPTPESAFADGAEYARLELFERLRNSEAWDLKCVQDLAEEYGTVTKREYEQAPAAPSREAMEMAFQIDGRRESEIAAALQQLMDERDEQMEWAKSTYAEMRQRAEAAEKDAEKWRLSAGRCIVDAENAEARLAECVREVRAYNTVMDGSREPWWPDLMDILDKYSPSATPPSPAAADKPSQADKGAK